MGDILRIIQAPGLGLLTVSSGKGQPQKLLGRHFKLKDWEKQLRAKLSSWESDSPFFLIGAPSDSGGGICRGAAHGPIHIRHDLYSRKKKWAKYDLGDIPCIPQLLDDQMLSQSQLQKSGISLWGTEYHHTSPVSPLNILETFLTYLLDAKISGIPLILGGDHSLSGPVFKSLHRKGITKNLAVLHFDAHTDLLEERFGVKECFGTWTTHALKTLPNPKAWVQVGIRASAKPKEHWESQFGLRQHWAKDCHGKNPKAFAHDLLEHWKSIGCNKLYITNDIDGTDSRFAGATGTPENNGLHPKWVQTVIKTCREQLPLIGADVMEVAPVIGSPAAAKKTVRLASQYIKALF